MLEKDQCALVTYECTYVLGNEAAFPLVCTELWIKSEFYSYLKH